MSQPPADGHPPTGREPSDPDPAAAPRLGVVSLLVAGVASLFLPPLLVGDAVIRGIVVAPLLVLLALVEAVRVRRLRVVATCALLLVVPWLWFATATSAVRVLGGPGPGGCRVVGEEDAFLMSGGGRVGVVPHGIGPVQWQSRYGTDDGERVLASGVVEWEPAPGRNVVVRLGGSATPELHVLQC